MGKHTINGKACQELSIDSAKSERVFSKRYQRWVEAAMTMEKPIEMYEVYSR